MPIRPLRAVESSVNVWYLTVTQAAEDSLSALADLDSDQRSTSHTFPAGGDQYLVIYGCNTCKHLQHGYDSYFIVVISHLS